MTKGLQWFCARCNKLKPDFVWTPGGEMCTDCRHPLMRLRDKSLQKK